MSKLRKDITNEYVKSLLEDEKFEGNITKIARYLGCSRALVRAVRNNKRNESNKVNRHKVIPKEKLCTCCGIREKAPGHKYLCMVCYKGRARYYEEYL